MTRKMTLDVSTRLNGEALIECIGLLILIAMVPLLSGQISMIGKLITVVLSVICLARFFKVRFYLQALFFAIIAAMSSVIFFIP